MTDLDLDAIKGRLEKVTPGPWSHFLGVLCHGHKKLLTIGAIGDEHRGPAFKIMDDATFVVHARTDIPALIAAYEAKCAEVERLRAGIKSVRDLPSEGGDVRTQALCDILRPSEQS